MQTLRRWNPGRVSNDERPSSRVVAARKDNLSPADVLGKDMAFCAEFAVHGGVAISAYGFKAETELLRMQEAGLLNLVRDVTPPFAVVRVTLSATARNLVSGERCMTNSRTPPTNTTYAFEAAKDATPDHSARRNGFEVARGMISAAIKAELSFIMPELNHQSSAAVASRVMTRINQIQVPF